MHPDEEKRRILQLAMPVYWVWHGNANITFSDAMPYKSNTWFALCDHMWPYDWLVRYVQGLFMYPDAFFNSDFDCAFNIFYHINTA